MKPKNCFGHWKPTASGWFLLSDPVKNHRIECVQNRVYFLTVFITPNLLLIVFRKCTAHDNRCHQKKKTHTIVMLTSRWSTEINRHALSVLYKAKYWEHLLITPHIVLSVLIYKSVVRLWNLQGPFYSRLVVDQKQINTYIVIQFFICF